MSPLPSPKRSASSNNSAGTKILVTAASLATMMGGWAALALQQSTLNAQNSVDVADDASQVVLDLPPLPTLVPEPSSIPTITSPNRPVYSPITFSPYSTPTVNPPVVAAQSGGNKNTSQKELANKSANKSGNKSASGAANKPAKDPVAKTGSSK
jgi:hypothetical protein